MNPITSEFKQNLTKTLESLREDLKSIRTGRATPALLENIEIEAYGGQMKSPLNSLASITTESVSRLQVKPFDPSIIQDIERAIQKSSLGLSPAVQGTDIFVNVPPLSEEQREKFVKLVGQKIEEKKNIIRNHRDEARKKIKNDEEKKLMSEDERFRLEKEIDEITSKLMEEINTIKDNKEKEIRQV